MLQETVEARAGRPSPDAASQALLEDALEGLDERLAAAARALATAQRQVRLATEAARQGNLRDLPRALDGLVKSSAALLEAANAAQRSWTFDGQRHLEEGRYVAELLSRARADGLEGAREVDGQLYSFPVILKVDARDLALKVGRKLQRGLRPSVVVGLLQKLRRQPTKDNLRQLAVAFEKAYLAITGDRDGVAIPLRRVYELLVLRPGQGREYTELDFLMDVYRLERGGPQVTPSGRELSLPASTGTRGGKGLPFVTETGEEKLYSSIRFDSR
jgi:hypothetical protein